MKTSTYIVNNTQKQSEENLETFTGGLTGTTQVNFDLSGLDETYSNIVKIIVTFFDDEQLVFNKNLTTNESLSDIKFKYTIPSELINECEKRVEFLFLREDRITDIYVTNFRVKHASTSTYNDINLIKTEYLEVDDNSIYGDTVLLAFEADDPGIVGLSYVNVTPFEENYRGSIRAVSPIDYVSTVGFDEYEYIYQRETISYEGTYIELTETICNYEPVGISTTGIGTTGIGTTGIGTFVIGVGTTGVGTTGVGTTGVGTTGVGTTGVGTTGVGTTGVGTTGVGTTGVGTTGVGTTGVGTTGVGTTGVGTTGVGTTGVGTTGVGTTGVGTYVINYYTDIITYPTSGYDIFGQRCVSETNRTFTRNVYRRNRFNRKSRLSPVVRVDNYFGVGTTIRMKWQTRAGIGTIGSEVYCGIGTTSGIGTSSTTGMFGGGIGTAYPAEPNTQFLHASGALVWYPHTNPEKSINVPIIDNLGVDKKNQNSVYIPKTPRGLSQIVDTEQEAEELLSTNEILTYDNITKVNTDTAYFLIDLVELDACETVTLGTSTLTAYIEYPK